MINLIHWLEAIMSAIFIEALKVDVIIGVFEWEKRIPQTVLIDLEIVTDSSVAAISDNIADALNYKDIAKRVMNFASESRFTLIETLAERTANLLIKEFKISTIKVTVNKPRAVRHSKNVRITVEKSAHEESLR